MMKSNTHVVEKGSLRSSMAKSQLPINPMPNNSPLFEKYKSKCGYDVISFFHSHQHHSKNLIFDKRCHAACCEENGDNCEFHPLICKKTRSTDEQGDYKTVMVDSPNAKVNKLIEENTSVEQHRKKKISTAKVQHAKSDPELVAEPSKHKRTAKKSWRAHRLPIGCNDISTLAQREIIPRNLVDRSAKKNSARTTKKHSNQVHRGNGRYDGVNETSVALQVDEATEAFVNQKLIDGDLLGEDKANDQAAKYYFDALETLNSNKDLFTKLLQDPDSILVKHIERVRDTQSKKWQTDALVVERLADPGTSSATESEEPINSKISNTDDYNLFEETVNCQCSEKTSVEMHRQAEVQNASRTKHDSQPVHHIIKNVRLSVKPVFFPFKQMKEKFLHAIGVDKKEQVLMLTKEAVRKDTNDLQAKTKCVKGKILDDVDQTPVKCREFATEEEAAAAASSTLDGFGESNLSVVNHLKGDKCQMSIERRINLPLFLSHKSVDLFRKQRPKSWDGISYDSFTTASPRRRREPATPQTRFFPYGTYEILNENVQSNLAETCLSPLNCNAEALSLACRQENSDIQQQISELESNSQELVATATDVAEITELENNESPEGLSPQLFTELNDLSKNEASPSSTSDSPRSPSCIPGTEGFNRTKNDAEQQSHVFVLDRSFTEDVPSPLSTQSHLEETSMRPLGIGTKENELAASLHTDTKVFPNPSSQEHESISRYANAILKASGLDWDELLLKYHTSEQFLDQSLFNNLDSWSNGSCIEHKLIFDYVNKVLEDAFDSYVRLKPWLSFVKSKGRKFMMVENAVKETVKHMDWELITQATFLTLTEVIEKDLTKSGTWMDVRIDADNVVSEIAEEILQDIVGEIAIE